MTTVLIELLSLPLRGFILTKLWLWFIVPIGAPAVGVAHSLGLLLVWRFFSVSPRDVRDTKRDDKDHDIKVLVVYVIYPLICWFIAWVYLQFMK